MSNNNIREYSVFDCHGELVSSTITKKAPMLKGRWFIVHNKGMISWIQSTKSLLKVKIVMLIASKATTDSPFVKISAKALATQLQVNEKTMYATLKELITENVIERSKVDGVTALIVNPAIASKGGYAFQEANQIWRKLKSPPIEKAIDTETGEITSLTLSNTDSVSSSQEL